MELYLALPFWCEVINGNIRISVDLYPKLIFSVVQNGGERGLEYFSDVYDISRTTSPLRLP
jgi:hypothetical protein